MNKPLLAAAFSLHAMSAVRRLTALLSFLATTNPLA
jgi:hypothetical protein